MKQSDMQTYEIGEHCFGEILEVNGISYENYKEEAILSLIEDFLKNNLNKSSLIREVLKLCLDYTESEIIESDNSHCEQCGNYNNYSKFKIIR